MNNFTPYINIHTHRKCEKEISIECIGVHPYEAESDAKITLDDISYSTEAIGEIGLDFSRNISRLRQESLFCEQLSLAEKLQLPVVIHSVRAGGKIMEILKNYSLKAVIFHGFIGSWHEAREAITRGYFLSFGHRCFTSPKTLDALSKAPLINIFFETDDHEITIEKIYEYATEYRSEDLNEIKDQLYKNYIKIFK